MPGKTPAPTEAPYALKSDKPADIEAATKPAAERLAAILEGSDYQPLSWLKKGTKKQLIVCNSSGVPQYVTMGGDATIAEDGTISIGAKKIVTDMLADDGVTLAKLADALGLTEGYLADEAVGTAKVKDKAITRSKLDTSIAPAVEVVRGTNQAIPHKTWTSLSFSEERFDTHGSWAAGAPTKLIATVPGIYYAAGTFGFAGNAAGQRIARIVKWEGGGAPTEALAELLVPGQEAIDVNYAGNAMGLSARPFTLDEGDWITLDAFQSGPVTLNVMGDATHKTEFGMVWLRPLP